MKYDISALGNALVDTQYKVSHEFLSSVGLEADSMTLASGMMQKVGKMTLQKEKSYTKFFST